MPSFMQVTFSPLGFKDNLHKASELPTNLTVLKKQTTTFIKDNFFSMSLPNACITKHCSTNIYCLLWPDAALGAMAATVKILSVY